MVVGAWMWLKNSDRSVTWRGFPSWIFASLAPCSGVETYDWHAIKVASGYIKGWLSDGGGLEAVR